MTQKIEVGDVVYNYILNELGIVKYIEGSRVTLQIRRDIMVAQDSHYLDLTLISKADFK